MFHKHSSRKDDRFLLASIIQAKTIRQLEEKVAALTSEKEELLQLMVLMKKRTLQKELQLDRLQQTLEALTMRLDESKAREEKMLQAAKESKVREKEMLEAQKESKPLIESIHRYTKPSLYAAMGATMIGDLAIDLLKEVVKKAIGDEGLEAWGSLIRAWIGPWLSGVIEVTVSWLPMFLLITKAAIIGLMIAAPILNLTVLVCRPLREGLRKVRRLFTSNK